MLQIHDRSLLWCEVPVGPLHVPLQGAVTLLALGEGVQRRYLLPSPVVGEGEFLRVFVLEEALQVPLSQFAGVFHCQGIKALFLFLHIAFPECELQEADVGAAVGVAGTKQAHKGSDDDDAPAQDLQTYRNIMN